MIPTPTTHDARPGTICPSWCIRTPEDHAATLEAEDNIPWHDGSPVTGDGWEVTLQGSGDDEDPYVVLVHTPAEPLTPEEALTLGAAITGAASQLAQA